MAELKRFGAQELPKFCYRCSKRLVETPIRAGFDPHNGEQRFNVILHCPTNAIARMVFNHGEYHFDYNGDEIIESYYYY